MHFLADKTFLQQRLWNESQELSKKKVNINILVSKGRLIIENDIVIAKLDQTNLDLRSRREDMISLDLGH